LNSKFKFALMFAFVMATATLPAWAGTAQGPPPAVPEPSSIILMASGIGGIGMLRHFRKR